MPPKTTPARRTRSSSDAHDVAAAQPEMPPPPQTEPRQPVPRLNSVSRRTPGGAPAGRPATSKPLKIKPKVSIRRSQQEREQAEREEQERLAARNAPEQSDRGTGRGGLRGAGWTRGGPLRGRGGVGAARGVFGGPRVGEGVASGPFGAGSALSAKKGRSGVKREAGTAYPGSTSQRSNRRIIATDDDGDTAMGDGARVKAEQRDARYGSSDEDGEDEEGPRVDIERINLISDDEGDEDAERGKGKGPARSNWGLKPVRLDRKEHRERGVGVSAESSSAGTGKPRRRSAGDDSLFIPLEYVAESRKGRGKERHRDVQFLRDERRWHGVYEDDDDAEPGAGIKREPDESADLRDVDAAAAATDTHDRLDAPKQSRRRKVSFRDPRPVLQTEEDRQEWERHQEDVKLLVEELGHLQPGQDAEDSTTPKDVRFGQLYLFQFPPILPALYDPIKAEQNAPVDPDSSLSTISTPTATPVPTPVAPSSAAPPLDDVKPTIIDDAAAATAVTAKNGHIPRGHAGKMTVHASGRTTISWGGTSSLQLSRGIDAGFLQDIVLADVDGKGGTEASGETNIAVGVNGLSGKFIVTPCWEDMLR